jgi:N-acetylglucosamine-6-phosphate deacetylase
VLKVKAIVHGKIIRENKIWENQVLLYDDKITAVLPEPEFSPELAEEIIDANGRYVSPGFINVHIHGCCGVDAMDDDAAALDKMCEILPKTGVTAFLPTTMTYDFPKIYRSLDRIKRAMGKSGGAVVLGAHVEGPFISTKYKGAQAAQNIVQADFSLLEQYKDVMKIITLAPERLDDYSFVELCRQNGICVSIGHSEADYEQALAAIDGGVSHVTHLFNAMPPLHHRKPGIIGAVLDSDVNCELIADNVHVHPALQRMVYRNKAAEHIILITDSMRACMLPDGKSELGGQDVFVENQVARLADGTIAGSVLTMDQAVKRFWENTGANLAEVVAMASANPAKELGLFDECGSIDVGKNADLVIFDENLTVFTTMVKGKKVYTRE